MTEAPEERIRRITRERARHLEAADEAQLQLYQAIRDAIASNDVSVRRISEITGLTRMRIYQIRDGRR